MTYDDDECKVHFEGKILWRGNRDPSIKLWVLPLEPGKAREVENRWEKQDHQANSTMQQANNAYIMLCKESLIKYLHQCLFCPPKKTLIAAIKHKQLTTWPGLRARAVGRYLPNHDPFMDKGHMKRHKKGIQSMKQKLRDNTESIEVKHCINPPLEQKKVNQLFASMTYIDKKDGIMYTDLTGNFPVRSIEG